MEINTPQRARASLLFSDAIRHVLDPDNQDVSFSFVDTSLAKVIAFSTNYQWHLNYWACNLDKGMQQRLIPGVKTWQSYDYAHTAILKKFLPDRKTKIDICTRHGDCYEIMSLSCNYDIDFNNICRLFSLKPRLSAVASSLYHKRQDELALPLRDAVSANRYTAQPRDTFQLKKWQFGHLVFTDLEIDTLRQLLMCRSVKEIAYAHHCSVKVERHRIDNIKQKAGCQYHPNSALFDILNQHGVIQACLANCIIYR
ncbi:hypothetical protein [Pantoea sp. B65]|uniref:hypothetical protein n=1 Tax=Pantoea sp. B65 TaxID=2813359 RepID=UPI0039B65868